MEASYIGHFRLESELGSGTLGTVFKAYDESLCRYVALKVLHSELTYHPDLMERFVHEAKSAAAINHPNVARIYFCGTDRGLPFIAMELVEGQTLHRVLSSHGCLPEDSAISIAIETAKGLDAGFKIGMTHNDIKPANLILTPTQELKILDFGLNRVSCRGNIGQPGSSLYLPPQNSKLPGNDPRVDIYSLGATIFHTITGHPPPKNQKTTQLILEGIHDPYVAAKRVRQRIHNKTTQIITRMMHLDRSNQYDSYGEIISDLYVARSVIATGEAEAPEQVEEELRLPSQKVPKTTQRIAKKNTGLHEKLPSIQAVPSETPTPSRNARSRELVPIIAICGLIGSLLLFTFSDSIFSKVKQAGKNTKAMLPRISTPFFGNPIQVPGKFEAEEYDNGGEGSAYHDLTERNEGNLFRSSEGVDLLNSGTDEKNFAIGWIRKGEWFQYSVSVAQAGSYDVLIRVSRPGTGGIFHIEVDGANVTGPIGIPDTKGWTNWEWIRVPNVPLSAGSRSFRVVADENGTENGEAFGNVDAFEILPASGQ